MAFFLSPPGKLEIMDLILSKTCIATTNIKLIENKQKKKKKKALISFSTTIFLLEPVTRLK